MERCIRISSLLRIVSFFLLINSFTAVAQVPAFDKLEQLYDQGRYRIVYRKAKRLLNKPECDYSLLPRYYTSLASVQLLQQKSWRESHESIIDSSFNFLTQLGQTKKGTRLRSNHSQELLSASLVLNDWVAEQIVAKENVLVNRYQKKVKDFAYSIVKIEGDEVSTLWEAPTESKGLEWAISLIQYAQTFIGTAYLWGGQSSEGFDCSGFTSYVFLNQGKRIPRVAKDQFAESTKLSSNEAHIGDLVFFGTNGVVSHVGILVNAPGQPKQMIHSSSSKGVVFQEIDSSKYYSSRIIGFGRY